LRAGPTAFRDVFAVFRAAVADVRVPRTAFRAVFCALDFLPAAVRAVFAAALRAFAFFAMCPRVLEEDADASTRSGTNPGGSRGDQTSVSW
jgi:hypothetical protein